MKSLVAYTLLLAGFIVAGCATGPANRTTTAPPLVRPDRSAVHGPVRLEFNPTNYWIVTGNQRIEVVRRDARTHRADLPPHIHMRLALLSAQEPEWKALMVAGGRDPSSPLDLSNNVWGFLSYFQASDGVDFLVDNSSMALWYRVGESPWTCALSHLYVFKTFGGVHPHLPVCYVGAERFLVAETLPGKTRRDTTPFPEAECATFLIDCRARRVIDRTQPITYDHNPPLVLPNDWKERYQIQVESGNRAD